MNQETRQGREQRLRERDSGGEMSELGPWITIQDGLYGLKTSMGKVKKRFAYPLNFKCVCSLFINSKSIFFFGSR